MSTFDLVDAAKGGTLAQELAELRADGLTYDELAARFAAEGYRVSRETIRRWVNRGDAS